MLAPDPSPSNCHGQEPEQRPINNYPEVWVGSLRANGGELTCQGQGSGTHAFRPSITWPSSCLELYSNDTCQVLKRLEGYEEAEPLQAVIQVRVRHFLLSINFCYKLSFKTAPDRTIPRSPRQGGVLLTTLFLFHTGCVLFHRKCRLDAARGRRLAWPPLCGG